MESVNVYEKFLTNEICDDILKYAKSNFTLDERIVYSKWHASINHDKNYTKHIFELIAPISPFKTFHISWINLTEYENNRELDLHYDERSNRTFTIVLTDNYTGGDFIVEDQIYNLNKGDCISFNGEYLLHGVRPVTHGYRAALNIWIKEGVQNLL